MRKIVMTIIPSVNQTQVLVTEGPDELMRSMLPAPYLINYDTALPQLAIAVAQCFDARIRVVVCAAAPENLCCLGLTDDLGRGRHSVFHEVEVVDHEAAYRGQCLRGVGDFRYAHHVRRLALSTGGRQ
jgi:hypothetical protein